jgi:hypothetical protein
MGRATSPLNNQVMKTIKSLKKLIATAQEEHRALVWNDPGSVDGNKYSISYLDVEGSDDQDDQVLIRYNDGMSEAYVYVHEISISREVTMLDRYVELEEIVNGWYHALPVEGLDQIHGLGAFDITLEGDEMEQQLDDLYKDWIETPFSVRCMEYDRLRERFYEYTKL